jgi:tetratricopeptide (TPR) repeat protein
MKGRDAHHIAIQSETINVRSNPSGGTPLEGIALIQRGNEYFFSNCYLEATGYYYQAAMVLKNFKEHRSERSKAWSNVSECHLRLQNWQAAEDASTNALLADPTNRKALYRRAKARYELGEYAGAAMDADKVGTRDAKDVAALCRELACAHFSDKLTTTAGDTGGTRQDRRRLARNGVERRDALPSSAHPTNTSEHEREFWFRRIIDSYRLRIDDEYTQTGASDAGCLYGIRAKGLSASPIDHFKAYVHRAVKKRVVPPWFSFRDHDELYRMATMDGFSNINVAVVPDDILNFYANASHDELQELRNLAVFIEGPIGMPWKAPRETRKINILKVKEPILARVENRYNLGGHLLSPSDPDPDLFTAGGVVVHPSTPHRSDGTHRHRPHQADIRHLLQHSTSSQFKGNNSGLYPLRDRYYQPFNPSSLQQHAQRRGPVSTSKRDKPGQAGQTLGREQPMLLKQPLHGDHQARPIPRRGENRSPSSPEPVTEETRSTSSEFEQQSFEPHTPYHQSSMVSQKVLAMSRPVRSGLRQQRSGVFYSQEEDSSTSQHVHSGSQELRDQFSELTELSP